MKPDGLPANASAELAILTNEIAFEEMIDSVREIVAPEDFSNDIYGSVQRILLAMRDNQELIDFVTVAEKFMALGVFEDFGGPVFLATLTEGAPSRMADAEYAVRHALVVKEKSHRRRALQEAESLLAFARDETKPVGEIWKGISEAAERSLQKLSNASQARTMRDYALSVARVYSEGKKATKYIGIRPIDDAIRGVAEGENVVIAGLTSHGKTMITMQWLHEAARRGIPSMIISKEMSGEALASRVIPGLTSLSEEVGEWHIENERLVFDIESHYRDLAPIIVCEHCGNVRDMERQIERAVREHKIQLVALDYLQLVDGAGLTREQQVADVSRRWKQSLMKNKLIGLLLSQLNREASKFNRAPQLSDLKDSGSVEQDADIVLFPFWEAKTPGSSADPFLYRVYVAKSRQRGTKVPVIELRVDPAKQWLYEAEPRFPDLGDF